MDGLMMSWADDGLGWGWADDGLRLSDGWG